MEPSLSVLDIEHHGLKTKSGITTITVKMLFNCVLYLIKRIYTLHVCKIQTAFISYLRRYDSVLYIGTIVASTRFTQISMEVHRFVW